jgi:hypothetical protein
MGVPLRGLVQGVTVVLDESVPPLDGKRVFVVLEPVDEEMEPDAGYGFLARAFGGAFFVRGRRDCPARSLRVDLR